VSLHIGRDSAEPHMKIKEALTRACTFRRSREENVVADIPNLFSRLLRRYSFGQLPSFCLADSISNLRRVKRVLGSLTLMVISRVFTTKSCAISGTMNRNLMCSQQTLSSTSQSTKFLGAAHLSTYFNLDISWIIYL